MRRYRKPYRVKKKKSILKNRFFWLGILALIVFLGISYFLVFSSFFQIKVIEISGNQKISTEELRKMVEDQIVKNLIFYQTKSIFLVNLKKIQNVILEKFPQISQINIKQKFPQTLEIKIEERNPVAIFCQNENCFFIDKEGVVFESNVKNQDFFIIKKGNFNSEIKLGDKIIDENLISQILEIESRLKKDFKISINEVLLVSEERVNFKTSEGWEIYFNPKKDINWQLTKLEAVLENEILPEKRKNLEYIELRFGNFANPKYKD